MVNGTSRVVGGERSVAGRREGNEDATLFLRLAGGRMVAAVADGMGGLGRGDVASRLALDVLQRELTAGGPLAGAVHLAHEALLREARDEPLGSTLVAALVEGEVVWVVNVGDSRAYHRGADGMRRVTRDHTVAAEAAEAGVEDAAVREGRWAESLTRSLGTEDELEVDGFGPILLRAGDDLLLCSDGLYRVVPDEVVEEILERHPDPAAATEALIEEALRRGSADNVSAVILRRTRAEGEEAREAPTAQPDRTRVASEGAGRGREEAEAGGRGGAKPGWNPGDMMSRGRHQRRRAERGGPPPGTVRFLVVVAAVAVGVALFLVLLDRLP